MNLGEMADFVCGKVRQTDSASVAKCKTYLRQRYEMIYADELWKDSVWGFDFTFRPDYDDDIDDIRPESFDATYLFPAVVDRLIALRKAEGGIPTASAESFYRWNVDEWARSGKPERFVILPRCVTILPESYTYHDLGIYNFETGSTYHVTYIDDEWERKVLSGTIPANNPIASDVRIVERIAKATSTLEASITVNSGDTDIAFAATSATEFPQRLPIRLFPEPSAAIALRALVKKRCLPLDQDGASPELRGVDNCLMAFAQSDMLQRARQYGKAQAVVGEAAALLKQLKAVAVVQERHEEQIIPQITEVSGELGDWPAKGVW